MKRIFFLGLFLFTSIYVFAQSFISHHISYLGKTVPGEFSRINESLYTNTNNEILLKVENDIVISSGWSEEYKSINEAEFYYFNYCNLFVNNNWTFFQRDLHCDVYKYANIYVVCSRSQLRTDGVFVITVMFYSEDYYDTLLDSARGSHHIFSCDGVEEIINLQPGGSKAKAYQIKQIRDLMVKHQLGADDE